MLPDTEGLHSIANTESSEATSSPGGGAVASRGFLIQTLAALFEILAAKPPFQEITLEPRGVDKFDFTWSAGEVVHAAQVKSSENPFTRSHVTQWVDDMLGETKGQKCSLFLAGQAKAERRAKLQDEEVIKGVTIRFMTSTLDGLVKQGAEDLRNFLKVAELKLGTVDDRKMFVDSLTARMMRDGTKSRAMKYDEFRELLREWTKTPEVDNTPPDEALKQAYQKTCEEIDKALSEHDSIRSFLVKHCERLVHVDGISYVLSDTARHHGLDMCSILQGIKSNLIHFKGQGSDWRRLLEVVGGLMTLAMNRDWVLEQRRAWQSAKFPGKRESLTFMQERAAAILPLVTAALTDSYVKLERVFEEKEPNPRQLVKPMPGLGRGVLSIDEKKSLKLFFIRSILGPAVSVDETDDADVEAHLNDTRDALRYARTDSRDVFFATNVTFSDQIEHIKELKLDHLLVITPAGKGNARDILADPIFLFSHAFEIFQFIKPKLSS
ncbi:MAG: hypothetical protein ACOYMN_13790 [Roseimicrobium sp.]